MSATTINIAAYSDALVVLGTAGVIVPILRRYNISPVLGYLGAGAIFGPLGLGSFEKSYPALFWFTVADAKNVAGIAELGIVFLLFLIGLELSLHRLMTMRRLVFGLGGLQVLYGGRFARRRRLSLRPDRCRMRSSSARSLSLSSTAIVLELLSNQERLTTTVGRASFSVLLAQDLAVIPILMFISILAAGPRGSVLASLGIALLQAAIAARASSFCSAACCCGRCSGWSRRRARSELFIATALFVIIAAGVIASQAGLSMALGAFVAGLLLAETEYRKAIEATIRAVQGTAARHILLHRRHGYRRARIVARAAVARRRRRRADRGQSAVDHRPRQAVSAVVAGCGRDGLCCSGRGGEFAFVGIGTAAAIRI